LQKPYKIIKIKIKKGELQTMKNKKFIELLSIETERLIIRPTSIMDIELILKMDKQEETQKFLGGIKNKTREERIKFLEKKASKFEDGHAGSLTICLKDGTPIGFSGLNIDEDNNNAEISYIFDEDYSGKGYCTEVSRKLIEVGFNILDLNKIYADTIEGNEGSKKVLEKLGFKHEGTRRKQVYVNTFGEYRDFLDYGLLKEEFKD
jgi:RimJ/RimL family protein N-acetyltransferase